MLVWSRYLITAVPRQFQVRGLGCYDIAKPEWQQTLRNAPKCHEENIQTADQRLFLGGTLMLHLKSTAAPESERHHHDTTDERGSKCPRAGIEADELAEPGYRHTAQATLGLFYIRVSRASGQRQELLHAKASKTLPPSCIRDKDPHI
jgi:hypothetical protein